MLLRVLLFITLAGLLCGCRDAVPSQRAAEPKPPMAAARGPQTPPSPEACTAAGGRWEAGGIRRTPMCFLDYPDAGRPCDAAGQCQGLCLVVEKRGQCQKTYPLFGCFNFLDPQGNRVGLCVD